MNSWKTHSLSKTTEYYSKKINNKISRTGKDGVMIELLILQKLDVSRSRYNINK